MNATTVLIPVDVETSLTKGEVLALAELADGKTVLELGAWLGHSTICIGQTARQLVSVDWHHGDPHAGEEPTFGAYYLNLHRYGLAKRVITVIGRFEQALPLLADRTFEFAFLDGFHSYEQVKADIELVRPKLAAEAAVAFHDYGVEASSCGGGAFGVTQAVQEAMGRPSRVVDTLAIFEE